MRKYIFILSIVFLILSSRFSFGAGRKIQQVQIVYNSGTSGVMHVTSDVVVTNICNVNQKVNVMGGYFLRALSLSAPMIAPTSSCPFQFNQSQPGVTGPDAAGWVEIPPGKMATFNIGSSCDGSSLPRIGHGIVKVDVLVAEDRGAVIAGWFVRMDSDASDQVVIPLNSGRAF